MVVTKSGSGMYLQQRTQPKCGIQNRKEEAERRVEDAVGLEGSGRMLWLVTLWFMRVAAGLNAISGILYCHALKLLFSGFTNENYLYILMAV